MLFSIRTYSEQTIAYIKQALLDGIIVPGDPVRETVIAKHLGISRGPVREALQCMLRQGLVEGEPQKAKHIKHLSSQEIMDSYCLGGTLESACITQSLDLIDNKLLNQISKILKKMETQSKKANGLAEMSQIDDDFHEALMSRCQNKLMVNMARNSCAHISKFLYYRCWDKLFSPKEFYERHKIIFEAVKTRDPIFIQKTLIEHYKESGRRLGLNCGKK